MVQVKALFTAEASKNGKFFDIRTPDGDMFKVKIAGGKNGNVQAKAKMLSQLKENRASEDKIEEAGYQLASEAIIDWSGLVDDNGNEFECTTDNKMLFLKSAQWFMDEVIKTAIGDKHFLDYKPAGYAKE